METIPVFSDSPAEKFPEEKVKPKKGGLKKMIGKTIALGSVIGLGVFGNMNPAVAEGGGSTVTDEGNTNKIEHTSKGSSLGTYYQKKFEHNDKEKAIHKEALKRAKEILLDKGIKITEKNKIEIELEANILSKIIVDGIIVPIDSKYYSAEEISSIKLVEGVSDSTQKTNSIEKKDVKNNSVTNKTVVSDDAKDFL